MQVVNIYISGGAWKEVARDIHMNQLSQLDYSSAQENEYSEVMIYMCVRVCVALKTLKHIINSTILPPLSNCSLGPLATHSTLSIVCRQCK
jgi:hypothetical protein